MRLKSPANSIRRFARLAAPVLLLLALFAPGAVPQSADTLTPEASTAKAKQLLQQLIDAFGGPTYLDIRDRDCEGRIARFGHNGEMTGYTPFKGYWRYPDASRTD